METATDPLKQTQQINTWYVTCKPPLPLMLLTDTNHCTSATPNYKFKSIATPTVHDPTHHSTSQLTIHSGFTIFHQRTTHLNDSLSPTTMKCSPTCSWKHPQIPSNTLNTSIPHTLLASHHYRRCCWQTPITLLQPQPTTKFKSIATPTVHDPTHHSTSQLTIHSWFTIFHQCTTHLNDDLSPRSQKCSPTCSWKHPRFHSNTLNTSIPDTLLASHHYRWCCWLTPITVLQPHPTTSSRA